MVVFWVGLVMEVGFKVIYNGVEIGWVGSILEIECDGWLVVKLVLDVNFCYISLILVNVVVDIEVVILFGNKYVVLFVLKIF